MEQIDNKEIYLYDLPNETLVNTFSKLGPREISAVARTCWLFNEIIESNLIFNEEKSNEIFKVIGFRRLKKYVKMIANPSLSVPLKSSNGIYLVKLLLIDYIRPSKDSSLHPALGKKILEIIHSDDKDKGISPLGSDMFNSGRLYKYLRFDEFFTAATIKDEREVIQNLLSSFNLILSNTLVNAFPKSIENKSPLVEDILIYCHQHGYDQRIVRSFFYDLVYHDRLDNLVEIFSKKPKLFSNFANDILEQAIRLRKYEVINYLFDFENKNKIKVNWDPIIGDRLISLIGREGFKEVNIVKVVIDHVELSTSVRRQVMIDAARTGNLDLMSTILECPQFFKDEHFNNYKKAAAYVAADHGKKEMEKLIECNNSK